MLLYSFLGFLLLLWLAKLQRDFSKQQRDRRERQRRQRVGLATVPGATGQPSASLDEEEARFLAKLRRETEER